MVRFNHLGGPYPMEEDQNGYWVKFEDYNLSELTHNKEMEKSYNRYVQEISSLKDKNGDDNQDTIDKLRMAVIIMSVIIFGGVAGIIFSWS